MAQASFTAAVDPETWGLDITLGDGTRLLHGAVSPVAEPGAPLTLTATFAPGSPAADTTVEAWLWRSGSPNAAAQWQWQTETWPGETVQLTAEVDVPKDAEPGNYWLMWRMSSGGEPIDVEAFSGDRVTLGVVKVGAASADSWKPAGFLEGPTLAVGGDVNLGRRSNAVLAREPGVALASVPGIADADSAYANLECVVGVGGEQGVDKGERAPFYYRGRPETLAALTGAGVDVLGAANNHAGDYGPKLLLAQEPLLNSVGLSQAGAGADPAAACEPVYRTAGELTVAFIAADTTQPRFAAGDSPGTCYAGITTPDALADHLAPAIQEARDHAHLVMVGVHWGENRKSRPTRETREAAYALIDAGADAILGSSAHVLQGIEVYNKRPILYDTGNLLFDAIDLGESTRSGLFTLGLDASGVRRVTVTPLDVGFGVTTVAGGNSAARTLTRLRDLSAELGSHTRFHEGALILNLPETDRRPVPADPAPPDPVGDAQPAAAASPPDGCVVSAVPEDAQLDPTPANGLTLLGARLEATELSQREGVWLESWWSTPVPVSDCLLAARVTYEQPSAKTSWEADHEPCDWGWPTSRWTPDAVYYDRYLLRPRPTLPSGEYTVILGGVEVGTIDVLE